MLIHIIHNLWNQMRSIVNTTIFQRSVNLHYLHVSVIMEYTA